MTYYAVFSTISSYRQYISIITNYSNIDDRYTFYYFCYKKKKGILLLLSFHSSRKVFFRKRFQPGERGNLIFKNVAQITERMYEARLVDTLCRGFTQPSELRPPKIVLEQSKLLSYGRARNFSSDQPGTK